MATRKRHAPAGSMTPILQEDAVLAFCELHGIKPKNAFVLWKWVIAHPTADDWAEVSLARLSESRGRREEVVEGSEGDEWTTYTARNALSFHPHRCCYDEL